MEDTLKEINESLKLIASVLIKNQQPQKVDWKDCPLYNKLHKKD